MPITKSSRQLVDEATANITTYTVDQVRERLGKDPRLQLVDIRDVRELEREGTVPGAVLAPRGMLEFWIDPASPYHKPALATDRTLVLFCNGMWCGQSPNNILNLLRFGYPAEKLKWYRGGMQDWEILGLTTIPGE